MSEPVFAWTTRPEQRNRRKRAHRVRHPVVITPDRYPGYGGAGGIRVACELMVVTKPYESCRSPFMLPDDVHPCPSCWSQKRLREVSVMLTKGVG